jgi:uncharacterized membrane protein
MLPLIILLCTFLITVLVTKLVRGKPNFQISGIIAMSVMLVFTSIGHFIYTKGMSMMLPGFIPYKTEFVYATGIIELLAAIGLLIPSIRKLVCWLLIIFFILILPANIYAAIYGIDYKEGSNNGPGLAYLWFRVPLQLLFIFWVYYFGIRRSAR